MEFFQVNRFASRLLVLSSLCLSAIAAPARPLSNSTQQWTFDEIPPSKSLTWYPCLQNYTCAMLEVPLDYSAPNGSQAALPLIRIAAQDNSPNGTYQGMILTNPGGPGLPGVDFILESGYEVSVPVVGTNFDLVAFDPRGLGRSIPLANCSASSSNLRRRAFGMYGPELSTIYWDQTLESAKEFGAECEAAIGGPNGAGPHMSTAVVATDMLSIVKAFAATERGKRVEDSSLLNYWGISYGTFVGETFASMYPDRVGRVLLDGVVDPRDYISGLDLSQINNVDAATNTFFEYCHLAGPKLCPFYTGKTAKDIAKRFENLFIPLNATLAAAQNWENATVISEALASMKANLRGFCYSPISLFPPLAQQLVAYESVIRNLTVEGIQTVSSIGINNSVIPGTVELLEEWQVGVVCSDMTPLYNQTYADISSHVRELESQSFLAGELWSTIEAMCTGWPIEAKWRFSGPFGGDTKNPILFVSNTLDPATPIINSQTWSPLYKGSEVLTIEGVGHTSMGPNNACAYAKMSHFFQTGKLPGKDSFCPIEQGPWGVTLKNLKPDGFM